MSDIIIPTDGELLKLCDRVTGLVANGPASGNCPDLARESTLRHCLLGLLQEAQHTARELCEVRGNS